MLTSLYWLTYIFCWLVYGLIVGLLAKGVARLLKTPAPVGFTSTILVAVAGSYIGGFINFLLGVGQPLSSSGILMGLIGGVVFCWIFSHFKLNQYVNIEIQKLKDQ